MARVTMFLEIRWLRPLPPYRRRLLRPLRLSYRLPLFHKRPRLPQPHLSLRQHMKLRRRLHSQPRIRHNRPLGG